MAYTAVQVVTAVNSSIQLYDWWQKKFDPKNEPSVAAIFDQHMFFGIVEDIHDPRRIGRCKVRMFDNHGEKDFKITTEELDWVMVMTPTTSPSVSGVGHSPFITVGSTVVMIPLRDGTIQRYIIIGTLPQISDDGTAKDGFYDKTGKFPRTEDESDINCRARGLKSTTDVDLSDNLFAHKPINNCKSEYTHNHVYETESGHVKEYDDTPGNERIHEKHASGTGYTILPDGTKSEKVVRDRFSAIIGDDTIEVKGAVTIISSEEVNIIASKDVRVFANESIFLSAKNATNISVGGYLNVDVNDYIRINTSKHVSIEGNEGITIESRPLGYCVNNTDSNDVRHDWDTRESCQLMGGDTYIWKLYNDFQTSNIIVNSYDDLILKSQTGDVLIESGAGKQIHLNKDTV